MPAESTSDQLVQALHLGCAQPFHLSCARALHLGCAQALRLGCAQALRLSCARHFTWVVPGHFTWVMRRPYAHLQFWEWISTSARNYESFGINVSTAMLVTH